MDVLINKQSAIDAIYKCTDIYVTNLPPMVDKAEAYKAISDLPSAQPVARDTNVLSNDTISRQAAIDALKKHEIELPIYSPRETDVFWDDAIDCCVSEIEDLPPAQPTLYGYDIKHLMLIAEVLRKENLPPERVTEALMDIGRIVSIVRDEFEESLREAMKQCKI